jgi:hypothetical protein
VTKRCPTCGAREKRSAQANARYWALLHVISQEVRPTNQETGLPLRYSPDTWHLYMRGKFLGCDDVRLPNGRLISVPRSTTDLDTSEFAEYMLAVESWAAEHDAYLPDLANA